MDAGEAVVAAVVAHFLKPEKYPLADSTTLLTVDGAGTLAAGEVVGAAAAGGCLEGGGSVFDRNIDKRPVDGGKVEGAVESVLVSVGVQSGKPFARMVLSSREGLRGFSRGVVCD